MLCKNNTGGTYRMLNLCTKCIVISCDVIWRNKTYGEYVPRKENTKVTIYIIQDKDKYYNWIFVKIYPVKTEVSTENVKTKQNVNTKKNSRGE